MADPRLAPDLDGLLARLVDGTISPHERAALELLLMSDPDACRRYVRYLDLHQELAQRVAEGTMPPPLGGTARPPQRGHRWMGVGVGVAVAALIAFAWNLVRLPSNDAKPVPAVVAHFGTTSDCRWVAVDADFHPGDPLRDNDRIELASGVANIEFISGASVRLVGPAVFEPTSANGGFLALGQLTATANAPESKGFTLRTRTATVVDIGTEFVAAVAADGLSRVDVTRGEVDIHVAGCGAGMRLRAGEAMTVEPGKSQVVVRIESGDGTPAFRFPTIGPPSDRDYADRRRGLATVRRLAGTLSKQSGPPDVVLDGRGQSKADAPKESMFFDDDQNGLLLVDLGRAVPIRRIDVYSWHVHGTLEWDRVRATQKYYVYGSAGDTPPAAELPLAERGWTLIARVNTDEFFGVADPVSRPAQQASSVTATSGVVGTYRYLLWDVRPSQGHNVRLTAHTFYGEIDVYADP